MEKKMILGLTFLIKEDSRAFLLLMGERSFAPYDLNCMKGTP